MLKENYINLMNIKEKANKSYKIDSNKLLIIYFWCCKNYIYL